MYKANTRKNRFIRKNASIILISTVWIALVFFFTNQIAIAKVTKESEAAISIRAATPKEEVGIILYTLRNRNFFQKHGYDVSLPDNEKFTELLELSADISQIDKKAIYKLLVREIYNEKKYENSLKSLGHAEEIIEKALPIFEKFKESWGFLMHESYDVILTLYGPGGIYYPKTGKIFLKTTAHGLFKRADPTHTIIHEMVHIGINENIVKAFQLTHWEKERVVDLICSLAFSDILHNYKLQPKGEKRLDAFINRDSIMNLPLAVKTYVNQKDDANKKTVNVIVVDNVFKGSQAEKVGIQKGDIILAYDGERVTSAKRFVEIVRSRVNKDKIELAVIRGAQVEHFVIRGGSIGIKITKNKFLKENLPTEFQ